MAGKGRGVGAFTFNIEALGIGRGSMPEARVKISQILQNTDFKPVPLKVGEDEDYMLALKQEMRGAMQRLPHNIKAQSGRADVEKYTERYLKHSQMDDETWTPDWNLFPKELMPRTKKPRRKVTKNKKSGKGSSKEAADVLSKLDALNLCNVQKSCYDVKEREKDYELEKKDDGNAEKSDDEPVEEVNEEDNDYIESYFDNGEDFAADSDDNMDGEATY
uniref:Polymerase (RNA) III (DNA directed) polypeptide G n=1 Tax=Poecilia formosa TaxID=48698 RepID=A0A087XNY3_POEFO